MNRVKQILDHYGPEKQMKKCIEECCELLAALIKYELNTDPEEEFGLKKKIIEEIADGTITVEQQEMIFGKLDGIIDEIIDESKITTYDNLLFLCWYLNIYINCDDKDLKYIDKSLIIASINRSKKYLEYLRHQYGPSKVDKKINEKIERQLRRIRGEC